MRTNFGEIFDSLWEGKILTEPLTMLEANMMLTIKYVIVNKLNCDGLFEWIIRKYKTLEDK